MSDDMDLDMGTVLVDESIEQTGDLHEPRTRWVGKFVGRKIFGSFVYLVINSQALLEVGLFHQGNALSIN